MMRRRIFSRSALAAVVLAAMVLAVFLPATENGFILYHDDQLYVTENPQVRAGLTLGGLRWALTSTEVFNWHPLTWLSHMLDAALFGLNPRMHHLVNVLWHLVDTLLLFIILRALSGIFWGSVFTAALFAIHPLHVESVAWVAERKDVLSTFFWLLTIGVYRRYARRPSRVRYLPVLLTFGLGLTAKSMLVTLPFVLLLLDFWPLGRIVSRAPGPEGEAPSSAPRMISLQTLLEKVPLFVLAGAAGAMTFWAQSRGGLLRSWEAFPWSVRWENAAVAYAGYLGKMVWPRPLAFLYPHPLHGLPAWRVVVALSILLAISFFAVRKARSAPYLAVGWFWYLGTLVPVIGLIQIGSQAMADRYSYVPLIGLFVIISWWSVSWSRGRRRRKALLGFSVGVILAMLMILARVQVSYWKDSITLFNHSLETAGEDWNLRNNLGLAYAREGMYDAALAQYSRALRLNPGALYPTVNMGVALAMQGRLPEALDSFGQALRLGPHPTDRAEVLNNIGVVLERMGQPERAAAYYHESLRLDPEVRKTRGNLERALARQR